jgi:AraC-like DNA-binding protein
MPHFHLLFRGSGVAVGDWDCRPVESSHGPLEASESPAIAFTRRGLYRKHVGSLDLLAGPGTVVFYPRWEEYRISHPLPGGDRCLVLAIDDEALEELATRGGGRRPFWATHATLPPAGALLARRLSAHAPRSDPLEREETALRLAAQALRVGGGRPDARRPATTLAHRRAVGRALLYLCARYREPLTLEEVAREACYSPFHLSRVFKRETGLPVHRYLNRLRLLAALEELDQGRDLTRVALSVGFSSHSHFTFAFHREFGVAPSRIPRWIAGKRRKNLLNDRP